MSGGLIGVWRAGALQEFALRLADANHQLMRLNVTVAADLEAPSLSRLEQLRQTILKAAEYLPNQGPVAAFVFDNPLRAFEQLKFDEAVKKAAAFYACQPYLTIDRFRQAYERGRITDEDLGAVLSDDLEASADESILGLCTRSELRLAMLKFPLRKRRPVKAISSGASRRRITRRARAAFCSTMRPRAASGRRPPRRWCRSLRIRFSSTVPK